MGFKSRGPKRRPTVRDLLNRKHELAEKNRKDFDRAWRKASVEAKQLFRLSAERIKTVIMTVNPKVRKDLDLCEGNGHCSPPKTVADGAAALLKLAGYDVSVVRSGRGRKAEHRIIYHHDPDA